MKTQSTAVIIPEVLPARTAPAGFQQQPQPIHIHVNMPSAPALPAPPAPPEPPVAQEQPVSRSPFEGKMKWIILLIVALVAAIILSKYLGSSKSERIRELEERLTAQQGQQPAVVAPTVVAPTGITAPAAPVQVESYGNNAAPAPVLHQRGGAVVSNVQEINTPDGAKWLLLYGPNGGSVSYPVSKDRSAASIAANMTWKAATPKPRVGKLEIFDSVPGQKEQMYIYAWKLQ